MSRSLPKEQMQRANDEEIVLRYIDKDGMERVCGGKDLKKTQSYPPLFGTSMASYHYEYISTKSDFNADAESDAQSDVSDESVSCIDDVLGFVRSQV
eukprot:9328142-Karenia_brevis.AAC.1